MRLLVLTRFDPLNGTSGSGTYLYAILKHLQQHGVEIVVCWSESPRSVARCGWFVVPRDFAGIATLLMYGAIRLGRLNLFPSFLLPFKARLRKTLKRLLCALGFGRLFRENRPVDGENREDATQAPAANPYAWDRPPDPYERAFFGQAIAKYHPDAILFNYCWMTPIVQDMADPGHVLKIALTYDLRHIYSTLVNGRIHWTEGEFMSKELETDYLRPTDLIVAIREDDAQTFRGLLPDKEVITAHPSFAPSPATRPPLPNRCLYVAADNLANREGLLWFLSEAWPKVRAANPAAELHICGTLCKTLTLDDPGVHLLGFVDSLQALYEEAAVVIVPLLRGSGVKIKLMEALTHGKACVSTPIGTEGIPVLDQCVAVARTAEEFAAHVAHLLADADARCRLEARALSTITESFSAEACYGSLLDHIQKKAGGGQRA